MSAKIVVACGSGVATSQAVANKIRKLLEAEGVEAQVVATDVASLHEVLKGAAAYVSVVKTQERVDVPTFNGVAFLTGMGQDEELARLVELVREA
ncbi:PTS sugar transporter subunit IIB [Olsenella urininfantis]|uniref:PTS sugar transporter subunit IIB n=1 Tax=Olsenella urininfantis TaxID=1871033 RepID=UPI0009871C03|nr:PTS sugar transporter subunit IIB [Olsenella urininfantis]